MNQSPSARRDAHIGAHALMDKLSLFNISLWPLNAGGFGGPRFGLFDQYSFRQSARSTGFLLQSFKTGDTLAE